MRDLLTAVLMFLGYLLLFGGVVYGYWGLRIRYGKVPDLDPDNWYVRLCRRGK